MFKNMKISIKILLVILIISLGALLVAAVAAFHYMDDMIGEFEQTNNSLGQNSSDMAQEALLEQMDGFLKLLVKGQAQAVDSGLYSVHQNVKECAEYTENLYANQDNFVGKDMPHPWETHSGEACAKYFLAKGVEETPEVKREVSILSNCEYMFAAFLNNNKMLNNIYIGTESGISYRYSQSNLYNKNYDPRTREWYQKAMETPDILVWLPTYVDTYGKTCITAAVSYRDATGNLAGVVASDLLLSDMIDDVMSLKLGESGDCFVLDENMQFIAHPDMKEDGFKIHVEDHFEGDDFIKTISTSDEGLVETVYEGKNSYVAFARMEENEWYFCTSIGTDEITAPAAEVKKRSDQLIKSSQEEMQNKLYNISKLFVVYFAIIGVIVIIISFMVSGTITRPIVKLASSVSDIGHGNFDQKILVETGGEIGMLVNRFNEMQDNLKEYLENIQQITAEKERIGAELSVAAQIQADMLPRKFPAFPNRKEFTIYAAMDPAKEVGGDFYDFFFTDNDHLAMVMADVSGKGVPAALFMAISKALIKSNAQQLGAEASPSKILYEVNNQLCEGNEAELFVTIWLAIIDLTTGRGVAANAGHEHPALRRKGGNYELIVYHHSPIAAAMEGIQFKEHDFRMNPGDSLYVYTDGVTEATDASDHLYGTERMVKALNKDPDADAQTVLKNVREDIDDFVKDAPQFDDLTMMCFQYFGPPRNPE